MRSVESGACRGNEIHFLNLAFGYGVAGGTLYHMSDAGVTWHSLMTPIAVGGLCFVHQDTGWMVNTSTFLGDVPATSTPALTALYATGDGGATWRQVPPRWCCGREDQTHGLLSI